MFSNTYLTQIIIIFLISFKGFSQTKSSVFYNEKNEKITKQEFNNSKNYTKNLDLYFENDTLKIGLLIKREKFGILKSNAFKRLKNYLSEISQVKIDSTKNIVINYLTALPKKAENTKSRSTWNVLDKNYIKKLHKIADINQFWICSPKSDNLKYYHQNKINWIRDKSNLFSELFFPYEVRYGNYILIKPDGEFYYYLGEHSKYQILENSKKFFNN